MNNFDPKSLVQRYYEEIANQRNLAVADELFAHEFKLFPDSQPPYGPESVRQFITWLCIDTFPDLTVTIEDLIAEGDIIAAGVTLHATHTSPITWISGIPPIAPTGKRFSIREYVFWRVSGHRIVERKLLVDSLGMLRQLDVIPGQ